MRTSTTYLICVVWSQFILSLLPNSFPPLHVVNPYSPLRSEVRHPLPLEDSMGGVRCIVSDPGLSAVHLGPQ